jgi:hypothetical protein
MLLTDGWLLWTGISVSILAILMKTYFDEVLIGKKYLADDDKNRLSGNSTFSADPIYV